MRRRVGREQGPAASVGTGVETRIGTGRGGFSVWLVDRQMTPTQIAASKENGRENGQESGNKGKGPITPKGKARVSFNALKSACLLAVLRPPSGGAWRAAVVQNEKKGQTNLASHVKSMT